MKDPGTGTAGTRRKAQRPRGPNAGTIALILRATGELLDESGYEALTTTAVARRAGVSTATVYRHFPDKHAILVALVYHLQKERAEAARRHSEAILAGADWRATMDAAMRAAYALNRTRPGAQSLRMAMRSSPELWKWAESHNEEVAVMLSGVLRRIKPALTPSKARTIARTVISQSRSALDMACDAPRGGRALIDEASLMCVSYLARYLD